MSSVAMNNLQRCLFAAVVILAATFGTLSLSSCGGAQERLLAEADALANTADADSTAKAIDLYASFITQYPDSEGAPRALRTQARLTQQRRDMTGALALYHDLLARYPGCAYADEAQFMVGYIYEEHVRDFDRARAAYQKVIDHYPESELAVSARHLLPHVGRAAEDWVEFQEEVTTQ